MRFKLEITVGGSVLSTGDVAGALRRIADQLTTRYGEGGALGSNIDRAISDDVGVIGRYAVVGGRAWEPDPDNLSLQESLRELALSLEHGLHPLQRAAGAELRKRIP